MRLGALLKGAMRDPAFLAVSVVMALVVLGSAALAAYYVLVLAPGQPPGEICGYVVGEGGRRSWTR